MKANNQLKLFVWHGVLTDYTDGVMFALAHDVEEARKAIIKAYGDYFDRESSTTTAKADLINDPEIVENVKGFFLWGGG